ncbi:Glucooligosaccharide oxidase [Astrocystis sublimbata]|nr:Glucooligosaccharide oxidase [Astrocystis sublimbata]
MRHSHTMDLKSIFTKGVSWPAETVISFPDDDDESFVGATERWTTYKPPNYAAAITPSDEAAVVQAVNLAVANNVPFLATGGRHGYNTTLGKLQNGLAIDLSKLKTVEVDAAAATLTVGGGVTVAEVVEPLYRAGLEMQTGTCSRVGMVGATLGGGVGRYQGLHGLVIDALLSVRLVTAAGDVVEVSSESHPDLFWGIRGAGANFGIVTAATYKIHKLTNGGEILNADFVFPGSATAAYFETLKAFGTLPPELVPVQGFFWDERSSSTVLIANWQYIGPASRGRALLAPILALNPIVQNISTVPWNDIIRVQGFGADAGLSVAGKNLMSYTANAKQLSVPSFEKAYRDFAEFFEKNPGGRGSCALFETFPNTAVVASDKEATAFPWRDSVGYYLFHFVFDKTDHETEDAAKALGVKVRGDFAATSGYDGLAVYNSYAGGDESLEEIYGAENLPRLVGLKKRWDPGNVFGYQNPLPTQYPG